MENASKALIIAGAILLSILIIALGMRIYNSSNSSAANADLSATEISSFNSAFESYEGKQKGNSVRTLITAVISSNEKNKDRWINIKEKTGSTAIHDDAHTSGYNESDPTKPIVQIVHADIVSNKTYNVEFKYNDTTGLIEDVIISQNS